MFKEEKIAGLQQGKTRLQLLKLTNETKDIKTKTPWIINKWQVRLNRKIIKTSISEYEMRKVFATYAQNIILQLKIY